MDELILKYMERLDLQFNLNLRPEPRITPEQYWADLNERMPD